MLLQDGRNSHAVDRAQRILQRPQPHLWRVQADEPHPEETTDEVKRSFAGLGDRAPQGGSAPPPHSGNSAGALHAPPCVRPPQSAVHQTGPSAQCPHQQSVRRREQGLAACQIERCLQLVGTISG